LSDPFTVHWAMPQLQLLPLLTNTHSKKRLLYNPHPQQTKDERERE